MKGESLLNNKDYDESLEFYTELMDHELFINDYYILFIIQNLENNTNIDEAKRFFDEQVTKEDKLRYDEILKCAKKINYIESSDLLAPLPLIGVE